MTQEYSWKYWKWIRDHFSTSKYIFWTCYLILKFIVRKMLEFWSDISTSTNKSRPGTHFKMCSRSWQYWRFEYHQKLLTQKWSYELRKNESLILGHFGRGGHFILVQPIWPMHQNKTFLEMFILVHQKAMISWSAEAWDPESVSWHCTRMKISRKFKFSCTIQGHCTRIRVPRIFLFWCKKKFRVQPAWTFFLL